MMLGWKQYGGEVGKRIGEFAQAAPEAVKGFMALNHGSEKTTHLDGKTRELIALAVAVTTRCDGCIAAHVGGAIKEGASKEEIAEALGVSMALNAGAAAVFSARVMDCYDEMTG